MTAVSTLGGIAIAFSLVLGTLSLMTLILRRGARVAPPSRAPADAAPVLHFDGERLVDAAGSSDSVLTHLPDGEGDESDLARLIATLDPRFPGLHDILAGADRPGRLWIEAEDGRGAIAAELWPDKLRLALHGIDLQQEIAICALQKEAQTLRFLAAALPEPVWITDGKDEVTWANAAYLDLVAGDQPDSRAWPPPRAFDALPLDADCQTGRRRHDRRSIVTTDGHEHWFQIVTIRHPQGQAHFASRIDRLVAAESAGKRFVQTLSATFAHLSIGLAIFDRDRRLVIFNPALTDLTGLPPAFLSARPQIGSFLDRLRDRNMLPEPKNYKSWRDQVSALEEAAVSGTYRESWTLPTGQTFRVMGRPHPDGAIAFTFEDISAEISLTRHFRSERENAQAILDSLDEAVAAFSAAGTLTLTNRAYATDWGISAGQLTGGTLPDELAGWRARCAPTPLWDELRRVIAQSRDRRPWTGALRLADGRAIECRTQPLSGGATLVRFRHADRFGPGLRAARDTARATDTEQAIGIDQATDTGPADESLGQGTGTSAIVGSGRAISSVTGTG